MKLKKINLVNETFEDLGTQAYDGVVHFSKNNVFYGYMNRTIYRNFNGTESTQHITTWSPGWYKTIEKSANDRDLIVSVNKNEIMIFFDVASDSSKNLTDLMYRMVKLQDNDKIRQFKSLSSNRLLIMTNKGRIYLFKYSEASHQLLSEVTVELDKDEDAISLSVSADEKYIAFSSRDSDRAFSRLFNMRITGKNELVNIREFRSPFIIKKKDSCFSDLNFDMKVGGVPILTAFQYSNLNIYIFAFFEEQFHLMNIIVPDCMGRICRSSVYKNKLMAMDSESKLITLTFPPTE
jgi:hypothetical protein